MNANWMPPEEWYASLPSVFLGAAALISDPTGRVLIVEPNYRPGWTFPGGLVEANEPPHQGCIREVAEEVGLHIQVGPLLTVSWSAALGGRPRPLVNLLFDGGEVAEDVVITLQAEELDAYRFATAEEVLDLGDAHVRARFPAALQARKTGSAAYVVIDG